MRRTRQSSAGLPEHFQAKRAAVRVAVRQLKAGEIDAYAANRQRLSDLVARTPGLRLLPDNFYAVEQAIIVAKGNPGLPRVDRMLDEVRASGLIAAAIARAPASSASTSPRRVKRSRLQLRASGRSNGRPVNAR